jgi:large subunit ribosomal protein L18
MSNLDQTKARRLRRQRYKLRKVANVQIRLSVFRSSKHIYAQIIDDAAGKTLVSASSHDKELALEKGTNVAAAKAVGTLIAARAKQAGVGKLYFDRGFYMYHGRVKALAEGAREGGLEF